LVGRHERNPTNEVYQAANVVIRENHVCSTRSSKVIPKFETAA
jgi:hypothetical protein